MIAGTIAFFIGLLALHAQADLPGRAWALLLPPLLAVAWHPWLRLPALAAAGFCWGLLWAAPDFSGQLPPQAEGVDLEVQGWVAAMPEPVSRGQRFLLEVAGLSRDGQPLPLRGRLQLTWYENAPPLRVGDRWAMTVRLKRPRGGANPGGFDYEGWLYRQGIAARGYVRPAPVPRRLAVAERYPLDRYRQRLAERIQETLAGNPHRGILSALAVGERQAMDEAQWRVLRDTGTAHLMAISGLHIGMVAGLVLALVRWGWGRCGPLARRWPPLAAGALAALPAAVGYALLAGFTLPTRRALVMLALVLAALLLRRHAAPGRVLALALLGVLLVDPAAPLDAGLWLSFGAVAALVYGLSRRCQPAVRDGGLAAWLQLQSVVAVGLVPATLILFRQAAWLGPLANLVAVPWTGLTVVPLTLLAVPAGLVAEPVQAGLLHLAAGAMDALWRFLAWLAALPLPSWNRPAPPLWALAFALPGMLLLLAPRGLPGRWLGVVLGLPLLCFPLPRPAADGFWFTLLDVGQGLAAVVRTRHHVLVYDTGPRRGRGFDAGRLVLLPYLRGQGIDRVDALVLSHADRQHSGGTRALLEELPVARVLTPDPEVLPVAGAQGCRDGAGWDWDGVHFRFLHPAADATGDDADSCVLHVDGPHGRLLLPGDLDSAGQERLLRRHGGRLRSELLVAPGQGAGPAPLPAFVAAVDPAYVLFSTGYRNPYGHPRPETRAGYGAAGATVLDSGERGAITFRVEGGGSGPEGWRDWQRRYWHPP